MIYNGNCLVLLLYRIVNSLEILADNIEIVTNVSTKDNVTLWEMSTQYIALASMQDKTSRNMSIMVEQVDGFPKFEIGKETPSSGNPTLEIKTPDSLFLDARKLNPNITVDRLNMLFFNSTTFFPIEPSFANKRKPIEILSNAFSLKVGKIGQLNLSNDIVWSIQLMKIKPKEQLKCAYWNTGICSLFLYIFIVCLTINFSLHYLCYVCSYLFYLYFSLKVPLSFV